MSRAAGYDGDTCADGTRGDRTRCLCVVSAFFSQTALEPCVFLRGYRSPSPSSVPGVEGGKQCQVGTR